MTSQQIILLVGAIAVISANILYIYIENDLTTGGADYQTIQEQITELKQDNIALRAKLYHAESFNEIQKEASASGFVPASDPVFIH